MSDTKRVGDLEVGQDLGFERRTWAVQRAAWVVMLLILAAALVGLVGRGPLSRATAGDPGSGLWAEYSRFERYQAPTVVRVHLGPGAGQGGKVRLWLSREFIETVDLEHVYPEPEAVEAAADRLTYVLATPDPSQPLAITYQFKSQQYWGRPVRLGLEAGPELQFSQFFYP